MNRRIIESLEMTRGYASFIKNGDIWSPTVQLRLPETLTFLGSIYELLEDRLYCDPISQKYHHENTAKR